MGTDAIGGAIRTAAAFVEDLAGPARSEASQDASQWVPADVSKT
jgi:hypothetical protein